MPSTFITLQSGTPAELWNSFLNEPQVKKVPPNKHTPETIETVKEMLQSVNPKTGHLWGCKEIANELGIGRYSVTQIDMEMRRKAKKKSL